MWLLLQQLFQRLNTTLAHPDLPPSHFYTVIWHSARDGTLYATLTLCTILYRWLTETPWAGTFNGGRSAEATSAWSTRGTSVCHHTASAGLTTSR
jgi:hypothetical protein